MQIVRKQSSPIYLFIYLFIYILNSISPQLLTEGVKKLQNNLARRTAAPISLPFPVSKGGRRGAEGGEQQRTVLGAARIEAEAAEQCRRNELLESLTADRPPPYK